MNCRALLTLTVAATMSAQDPVADSQLSEQLRLAERALQRVTADVERLVDMRMRHDLGLLGELDEEVVRVEVGASSREMDRMRRALADLQARNAVLAGQQDVAQRLLAERDGARAPQEFVDGAFVPVPRVGVRVADAPETDGRRAAGGQAAASPAGEVRPATVRPEELGALALDPIQVQIHGSADHLCVARSLYKAGQALMDRAALLRRHGRADAAKQLDDRGRERLDRALHELKQVNERRDAPFVALFYQSRCLELLFRYDERYESEDGERLSLMTDARRFNVRAQEVRDPLLRIVSAPEVPGRDADEEWRQAAKTAMEHFRWMNIHAGYDTTARIQGVTWPGEERR